MPAKTLHRFRLDLRFVFGKYAGTRAPDDGMKITHRRGAGATPVISTCRAG